MSLASQSVLASDSTSLNQLLPPDAWQAPSASVAVRTAAPSAASVSPETVKLRKAAGDFEAILLESLWKSMKETFQDPDDGSFDPSLETFDDYGMQAMASAVGSSGGLGIKNMILKYLEPRIDGNSAAGTAPVR